MKKAKYGIFSIGVVLLSILVEILLTQKGMFGLKSNLGLVIYVGLPLIGFLSGIILGITSIIKKEKYKGIGIAGLITGLLSAIWVIYYGKTFFTVVLF
jgi:hypothetical protein